MMVEETVYDEELTCDHSYDQRCHTSYVTTYRSQQEEECEENFRKVCYINFEPRAFNETVEVRCHMTEPNMTYDIVPSRYDDIHSNITWKKNDIVSNKVT